MYISTFIPIAHTLPLTLRHRLQMADTGQEIGCGLDTASIRGAVL